MDTPQLSDTTGATQEGLLHRIANRIRQSLDLQEILDAMVADVRDYLEIDRVKAYRFNPDSSGVVIAESINHNRLPSLLGLRFPADDIPPYARELFLRARQRTIVDIHGTQIGISPLENSETGQPERDGDIRYRPLDPCHKEYLNAMGVQSSIVVPIVLEDLSTSQEESTPFVAPGQLWGLLACHHSESREVTETELQFVQAVVDQVSVSIAQSDLLDQVRAKAKQEANINRITHLLYDSHSVNLQAALAEVVKTFEGSGGRIYLAANSQLPKEIYTYGSQPEAIDEKHQRTVEENYIWQNFIHSVLESKPDSTGHNPWSVQWMRSVYELNNENKSIDNHSRLWAIRDIYREPLLRTLAPFFQATSVRGLLLIPLCYGCEIVGCLTIFRDEIDTEILWAGAHIPDTRQLVARQSFEVWRQEKTGEAPEWTEDELNYARALSERFANAIKQHRLYQQVQALNSTLEQQVEERTEQLQKKTVQLQLSNSELEDSIIRQEALSNIVAKIRESLDIHQIFQTATQALTQVLEADRVAVYQFNDEWGGEFVAEFECLAAKGVDVGHLGVNPVWDDTYLQENEGGRYRNNDISVVNDIYTHDFSQCHLDLYEQFQVKAFIIVPIFIEQTLWGLLGVYQHQASRQWENSEVEFVRQIAAQLGVALQHALLLARDRQQNEQLSAALIDLKETQTQLIQTEKMSSLGQMVAGIAHEINNPVNFIHGNVKHLQDYSNSILNLLTAYQAHYSQPPAEIQALLEETEIEYLADDLPKILSSLSVGTERIRLIVSSLRNFSRLDEAEIKAVDLHDGIEGTLLILQHRLVSSSISIEIQKDYGNLPLVKCHAGQINQVFMNLLNNAIDELQTAKSSSKTKEVKTIQIRTQQLNESWVRISIKDDGKGIPQNILHRLFDPFFTTKAVGKGTGLGLSISFRIIENHQGKLYCESEIDKGSEFIIELPIESHTGNQ